MDSLHCRITLEVFTSPVGRFCDSWQRVANRVVRNPLLRSRLCCIRHDRPNISRRGTAMEPPRLGFHPSAPNLYQPGNGPAAGCCNSHNYLCRVRNGAVFHTWFSDCIFFGATRRQTKTAAARLNHCSVLGELLDAHAGLGQLAQQRRVIHQVHANLRRELQLAGRLACHSCAGFGLRVHSVSNLAALRHT